MNHMPLAPTALALTLAWAASAPAASGATPVAGVDAGSPPAALHHFSTRARVRALEQYADEDDGTRSARALELVRRRARRLLEDPALFLAARVGFLPGRHADRAGGPEVVRAAREALRDAGVLHVGADPTLRRAFLALSWGTPGRRLLSDADQAVSWMEGRRAELAAQRCRQRQHEGSGAVCAADGVTPFVAATPGQAATCPHHPPPTAMSIPGPGLVHRFAAADANPLLHAHLEEAAAQPRGPSPGLAPAGLEGPPQ